MVSTTQKEAEYSYLVQSLVENWFKILIPYSAEFCATIIKQARRRPKGGFPWFKSREPQRQYRVNTTAVISLFAYIPRKNKLYITAQEEPVDRHQAEIIYWRYTVSKGDHARIGLVIYCSRLSKRSAPFHYCYLFEYSRTGTQRSRRGRVEQGFDLYYGGNLQSSVNSVQKAKNCRSSFSFFSLPTRHRYR